MADNNIYVGMRYVPVFDGEYDTTKTYEPLTIVSINGNSYTSKTYVPVNTAPPNDDYWALTGNYNAQIEAYRKQVEQLQNAYNNMSNTLETLELLKPLQIQGRIVAFFGDSLTYGITRGGSINERADKPYPTIFGEITGATIRNYASGGASCIDVDNSYVNLSEQIANATLNDCDYVFVCIGFNDASGRKATLGNYESGMKYFRSALYINMSNILAKVPSTCSVYLLTIPPTRYSLGLAVLESRQTIETYNRVIVEVGEKLGINIIDFTYGTGINTQNYRKLLGDSIHFTQEGYNILGRSVALSFMSGRCLKNKYGTSPNMISSADLNNTWTNKNVFNGNYDETMISLDNNIDSVRSNKKYQILKGESYSLSFDVYNSNVFNDPTKRANIIPSIYTPTSRYLNPVIQGLPSGITHYEFANLIATDNAFGSFELRLDTTYENIQPLVFTNITLNRGKYPTLAKGRSELVIPITQETWTHSDVINSQNGYMCYTNGLLYYSFQLHFNAEISANTTLGTLTLNPIFKGYGVTNPNPIITGVERTTGEGALFRINLNTRVISTRRSLPAGDYEFNGVMPVNFN